MTACCGRHGEEPKINGASSGGDRGLDELIVGDGLGRHHYSLLGMDMVSGMISRLVDPGCASRQHVDPRRRSSKSETSCIHPIHRGCDARCCFLID